MKVFLSIIIILSLSTFVSLKAFAKNFDLPMYSQHFDDKRNPFDDAKAAIALAKKTNRQVLIKVGGNWCGWCHKMDGFIKSNPDIYQALHSNYVLLKVNVSDSNENEDFMKSLPPTLGYPHIYVSDANGKMLLSKDTAELLLDSEYSREYWLTFLKKWSVNNTTQVNANQSNTAKLAAQQSKS